MTGIYPDYATFSDRGKVDRRSAAARSSIRLALEELQVIPNVDHAPTIADALAAADAHLEKAREEIENAFQGIDS